MNPDYFKQGSGNVGKQILLKRYERCRFAAKDMMSEAVRNAEVAKARATVKALLFLRNQSPLK